MNKIKVVALLPFKNEEKFLPTYVSGLVGVVDCIIAIDDNSTDNGANVLLNETKKHNIELILHKAEVSEDWSVDHIRQQLLELGRLEGGTHFVCLDADETFTGHFKKVAKHVFHRMEQGQKLSMQWLAMWKSVDHYRDDNSVWSNNFKDFVVCDDGKHNFGLSYLCEPRTPGPNNDDTLLPLNPKYGAVYHFQFSDFDKFQLKQSWYRCREAVRNIPTTAINQKYSITLDDLNVIVASCPASWMENIKLPIISYNNDLTQTWHYQEISKLFKQHGLSKFKDLNIWHVPELSSLREKNE